MRVMEELQSDLKSTIVRRQREDHFIKEEIQRITKGRQSEFNLEKMIHYGFRRGFMCQIYRKLKV
jgi:hypothetical protein